MSRMKKVQLARWNEPLLMQMSHEGERGMLVDDAGEKIKERCGDVATKLPDSVRRTTKIELPELSQPHVYRHYLRLSQMTMGQALTPDISQGTCTMKYSPIINETLCMEDGMTEMHPLQDVSTMQGTLEMHYRLQEMLKEISGMDAICLQGSGGSQGVYINACLIRAYHESRGEGELRNEIISTAFSHPIDCAAPHTVGFKVITLYPDPETGYPSVEALKAAISSHTAGLMITNPEDTGIYNPNIEEFVKLIHEAGGLCAYDQANANGILGVARARDAGFDLCHFNLHKTFSSPHGSYGPGCAASCVVKKLEPFLPKPVVVYRDGKYDLDYDRPQSIGKARSFLGNVQVMLRCYAWIMSLGADGLRKVAELAVLNNNYLLKRLMELDGFELPYPKGGQRLEQTRYSLDKVFRDTGITGSDIRRRVVDYGIQSYHESHFPVIIPNPVTLEPTETYSKEDMDYYVDMFKEIIHDAYADPSLIKNAPEFGETSQINEDYANDERTRAMTWRAYVKKNGSKV